MIGVIEIVYFILIFIYLVKTWYELVEKYKVPFSTVFFIYFILILLGVNTTLIINKL